MTAEVVIVGGGLAGLSAAAALAERGVRVNVLESRPRWGGRAASLTDAETGTTIDNCQHVSLGCCTNFEHFCGLLGLTERLQRQSALYFIGPEGKISRFAAGVWPAPFHLEGAFRKLGFLSPREVREILRALRALCRERTFPADLSFLDWLRNHQQSERVIERFWRVVLVSALSETLERIAVPPARKVFVEGFLANRTGWQVRIPVGPLDDLYGQTLCGWFSDRGAQLRLKTGVKRILLANERITAVELRSGEQIAGEHFVLAVPHHRLAALLPEPLRQNRFFAGITRLETSPISSVHLWFDRPITNLPHAVFVGRLSQWMFNRNVLQASSPAVESRRSPQAGCYYQVVISASGELQGRSSADVIDNVVEELSAVWPATRHASLLHSRLITEHQAVFSPTPGSERLRPPQQTPLLNLQLAGDWTATGWPATMESAVRSGFLAAENVLAHLGRPERILQPDLPVSFLSRILLRL